MSEYTDDKMTTAHENDEVYREDYVEWLEKEIEKQRAVFTQHWLQQQAKIAEKDLTIEEFRVLANELSRDLTEAKSTIERLQEYHDRREKEDAELDAEVDRIMRHLPPLEPTKSSAAMQKLRRLVGRDHGPIGEVIVEAADEIERLQKIVSLAEMLIQPTDDGPQLIGHKNFREALLYAVRGLKYTDPRDGEIERLRAEITGIQIKLTRAQKVVTEYREALDAIAG